MWHIPPDVTVNRRNSGRVAPASSIKAAVHAAPRRRRPASQQGASSVGVEGFRQGRPRDACIHPVPVDLNTDVSPPGGRPAPQRAASHSRRLRALWRQVNPLLPPSRAVVPVVSTEVDAHDGIAKGCRFLDALVAEGTTSGACLAVLQRGARTFYSVGHSGPRISPDINRGLRGNMTLRSDSIFMAASITKPVTAMAVMLLAQEGKLTMHDRVADHLSGFHSLEIRVHQLLSHTSGLPDSWDGNHPLRKRHAALAEYVSEELTVKPIFQPGTNVSYSSVAIDLAAAIVEKVAGKPLSLFLHERVFQPLGMADTSLGHPRRAPWSRHKIREVCLNLRPGRHNRAGRTVGGPDEPPLGSLSFGNSDYWRELGCPSGGLCTTAPDLLRLMEALLRCRTQGTAISGLALHPDVVAWMTRSHTDDAVTVATRAGVALFDHGCWGLGWRVNAEGSAPVFGTESRSSQTFGAHGSSGCMVWADPTCGMACVVLTPEPDLCESSEFNVLSDMLCNAQ
jgi:CubicO group peptidase (beta-lactamase class C family)